MLTKANNVTQYYNSAVQQTYVNHTCNLKFSSSHINGHFKKQIKLNNMFYLTHYNKNIISMCNQYKIINLRYLTLFFGLMF